MSAIVLRAVLMKLCVSYLYVYDKDYRAEAWQTKQLPIRSGFAFWALEQRQSMSALCVLFFILCWMRMKVVLSHVIP